MVAGCCMEVITRYYAYEFITRYYAYEIRWWHDVVWKLLHGITRKSLLDGITRTR